MGYLIYAKIKAPELPCGCLGTYQAGVSQRSVFRAVFLVLLSILGWFAEGFWSTTILSNPPGALVLGSEIVILVGLSPEINTNIMSKRLLSSHNSKQTLTNMDCSSKEISFNVSLQQLEESHVFQRLLEFLEGELVDHWSEACWRFLCHEGKYQAEEAIVVFAIPISDQPEGVRAAIVDKLDDNILLTVGTPS